MVSTDDIKLRSLAPYRYLFPKAKAVDSTVHMGASVFDTVAFIPEIIEKCSWQVKKFVDQELRGLSTYQACEKLWYFVKHHIKYVRDARGKEQVRSPRRLIHDAFGDCDCFTTFIGCCLNVLGVKFTNRICAYAEGLASDDQNHFQHIYPIVPLGNGKYIVMDCVVSTFDFEEPYTIKKDYKMELQFLDGIEDRSTLHLSIDAQDLFDEYEDSKELGKLFKNNPLDKLKETVQNVVQNVTNTVQNTAQNVANTAQNVAQNVVNVVKDPKQLIHAVNIVNPATTLLRLGFLASMKLNLMAVASNIKWGYLSKDDALAKGIDPDKYDHLKKVLTKAEDVFFGAGGNKNNLREAILTGRGNENREVAGLGYASMYYNRKTPLPVLLGRLYYAETMNGLNGNGLGEPVEAAAIAAAATAVGALAVLIKNIGDIFKRKRDAEQAAAEIQADPAQIVIMPPVQEASLPPSNDMDFEIPPEMYDQYADSGSSSSSSSGGSNSSGSGGSNNAGKSENADESFWDKNKKWALPTSIVLGVGTVAFIGYKVVQANKSKAKVLSGVPRNTHKPKKRKRNAQRRSTAIALM